MELWQTFLELWRVDPWWFIGTGVLLTMVVSLFLFSFFRNIRQMVWFYGAMVLAAVFFQYFLSFVPGFLEVMASYRSDWSLVFLSQNISFTTLLTQFLLFLLLYAALAIGIFIVFIFWSLLTFRWQRLMILLRRSIEDPWYVIIFALASVVTNNVLFVLISPADQGMLLSFFLVYSFLFCFQFVLRLLDHAQLYSPSLFLEFAYSIACAFFIVRFTIDLQTFLMSSETIHGFFLIQLFSFFLMLLLVGYFTSFLIKAVFASPFFLNQLFRTLPVRMGIHTADKYLHWQIILGLAIALMIGCLFLMMLWLGLILPVVLLFFLSFFGLFYLLDRLEDLRIRGDLVEKRLHSASHRTFLK